MENQAIGIAINKLCEQDYEKCKLNSKIIALKPFKGELWNFCTIPKNFKCLTYCKQKNSYVH